MERHSSVVARNYRIVDPVHLAGDWHLSSAVSAPNSQKRLASLARKRPTFINNAVRTAKYSYLSFLPLCLLQEFRRVSESQSSAAHSLAKTISLLQCARPRICTS